MMNFRNINKRGKIHLVVKLITLLHLKPYQSASGSRGGIGCQANQRPFNTDWSSHVDAPFNTFLVVV